MKILSESLASSASKAEKRISDNRFFLVTVFLSCVVFYFLALTQRQCDALGSQSKSIVMSAKEYSMDHLIQR